jgi:hypothetical protein
MAVGVETIGNDKSLEMNTSGIRFLWSNAKPVQSTIVYYAFERVAIKCAGRVRKALRLQPDSIIGIDTENHNVLSGR